MGFIALIIIAGALSTDPANLVSLLFLVPFLIPGYWIGRLAWVQTELRMDRDAFVITGGSAASSEAIATRRPRRSTSFACCRTSRAATAILRPKFTRCA